MSLILPFTHDGPVVLAGGGEITAADAALARDLPLIAADGGADVAAAHGLMPRAVIGDLDSLSDIATWRARGVPVFGSVDQETTDFDKGLAAIAAPAIIAIGFTGRRVDHLMAVMRSLVQTPLRPVLIVGGDDVVFASHERLAFGAEAGRAGVVLPDGRRVRCALGGGCAGAWQGSTSSPVAGSGPPTRQLVGGSMSDGVALGMLVFLDRARLDVGLAHIRAR